MSSTQSRPSTFIISITLLAASLFALGGCSSSSSGREAYFEARSASVMFTPGSGQTRISLWPASPFGNDLALADSSNTSSHARVTDSGPP